MADQVVTTFTADTSALESQLQEILDRIGALEGAANSGSASLEKLGASSAESAGGLKETENAAAGLLERLEALGGAAGVAGGALSALGLEGAAGAEGVEALSGALKGLMSAAPQLLAIGAAIAAVGAAFSFVKDAVGDATQMQSTMATLGATVQAQGDNWDALKDKVEAWAQSESVASGITQNELVTAVNSLVTSGMNLQSAMAATSIAEEVAVARHINLSEVTNDLISAEAGRTQGLARLDANLKPLIARHASLSEIMAQLHKDDQHALTDNNSLALAQARLGAEFDAVKEKVGDALLPVLTELVKVMGGVFEAVGSVFSALGQFGTGIGQLVSGPIMAAVHGFEALWDAIHGKGVQALAEGKAALGDLGTALHGLGNIAEGALKTLWATSLPGFVINTINGIGDMQKHVNAAIAQHQQDANAADITSGAMGTGTKKKGHHHASGSSTGFTAQDADASSALNAALNQLEAAHKAVTAAATDDANAHKVLHTQIDTTMTSAKAAQEAQAKFIATKDAIPGLEAAVRKESDAEHAAQAAVQQKAQAYAESVNHLNAVQDALKGKTKLTADEKKALDEAKQSVHAHATELSNSEQALHRVTTQLTAHTAALQADTKATQAAIDAQNKLWESYNDSIAKDQEQAQTERDTYGMSIQQQLAYWTQRVQNEQAGLEAIRAAHGVVDPQILQQDQADYQKLLSIQTDFFKQSVDKRKAAQQQEEQLVTTFFDDILSKHMSFKDAFKNVWDDIVKIFIADIEKMIVESKLFKSIFGNMGVGGGFNPLSFLGMGSAPSGAASAVSAVTSASAVSNVVGTPGAVATSALHVNIAGISPNASLGAAAPTGGLGSIMPMLAVGAGIFGMGNSIGNLISGGGPGNTHGVWGGVGALAGGAAALGMMGIAAGGGFGGLMSAAGLAALGPAGWGILLGGAVLGAVAGGLFGHKDNPANMPDKYDTQNYGTIIADLTGSAGANGQHFTEQSSLSQASGGQTGIAWVEKTLAQYANKDGSMGANTPDWLKPMWNQLVGAFGISATGSGQLNFGHAINNEWITGAQGVTASSNNPMQYTDLGNLLNQFYTAQQKGASNPNSNIPIFSLQRMAPDFNTGTFVAWSASTGTGSGLGGTRHILNDPITLPHPPIHIHLDNGVVVGTGGMNELADKIEQMLARNRFYNYNNRSNGNSGPDF